MILLYYISAMLFFMMSLIMFFYSMMLMNFKLKFFIEWFTIQINSININMYMYYDWMTLLFIFTVMIISSMIMFYCIEYMSHEINKIRFFWILLFFIISMIIMIISPNILTILIGWDGLGLTSYCLIIHYQSKNNYNCGMLTVLINRLGDIFIIMSISLLMNLGSWNLLNYNNLMIYMMMFIVLAAFTKSAQFPFSSWLPAAMAAPTPVSSLVHSSTLVTAGIYMLIRFNNLLLKYYNLMFLMMLIGLITMTMAGMSANFEFDLKKIIAYSTLSQLGLMVMILSMNKPELSFFHLITHAMFKSMMFMCSGVIIHSMNNYQDIRFMGKIKEYLPFTTSLLLISNYSLCGMPFFSGFYSKDMILENMFLMKINLLIYFFILFATMLTVIYSFRLMYYLMNNKMNFLPNMNIKEFKLMNYSMLLLMILSIKFGMIMNWLIFNNIEVIFLMKMEKLMILIICLLGFILGTLMFKLNFFISKFYLMKFFLGKMWFSYKFNYLLINHLLKFGKFFSLIFDKSWSEEFFKQFILFNNKKLNFIQMINLNYLNWLIMMLSYVMISLFLLY